MAENDQNEEKHRWNGNSWQLEHGTKHHCHRSLLAVKPHYAILKQNIAGFVVVKHTFNGRTQFYDTLNKNKKWQLYHGPEIPFPVFS